MGFGRYGLVEYRVLKIGGWSWRYFHSKREALAYINQQSHGDFSLQTIHSKTGRVKRTETIGVDRDWG